MEDSFHKPVLLQEVIEILDLHEGDLYFDATLGEGGHALEVFRRMGQKVVLAGIDADPRAVETSRNRLEAEGAKPKFATLNFRKITEALKVLEIERPTKILFDLGWNKSQFEDGGKGFSFQKDEPLIMTFGESAERGFNTSDIVNTWDQENIATILDAYGEEKFAWKISQKIVEARAVKPIKTSGELAEIVKSAVPIWYRFKKIHPATKTFQALRIAVNDELQALEEGLKGAIEILQEGGRVVVVSFHSLEDRIVKRFFKLLDTEGKVKILNKKPIVASEQEISENPRSRSAKLRVVMKLKDENK